MDELEFRVLRGKKLKRLLTNKGWGQAKLAEKAGCDVKTVRNLFSGEGVSDRFVVSISQSLGIEPELENTGLNVEVADYDYGGYLRNTHRQYESYFHSYRRSFHQPGQIFRAVIEIKWDDIENRLVFCDYYALDESEESGVLVHAGPVYISAYTHLIHLLTIYEGSVRLTTLTKMFQSDGMMRGTISTQTPNINVHQPVVSAVCLQKLKKYDPAAKLRSDIGLLGQDSPDFAVANDQLNVAEKKIVKIIGDQSWQG